MLWSLIKIIAFIVVVTGLTYGATQLLEVEGGASINIAGTELTLRGFVRRHDGIGIWRRSPCDDQSRPRRALS